MHLKLFHKLFLALLICTGAVLLLMAVLMQWQLKRGFKDYVNRLELESQNKIMTAVTEEYVQSGGWERLENDHYLWRELIGDEDLNQRQGPLFGPRRFGIDADRPSDRPFRRKGPRREYDGDQEGPSEKRFGPRSEKRSRRKGPPPGQRRPPVMLYDADMVAIFGPGIPGPKMTIKPVKVDDAIVGYLAFREKKEITEDADINFLEEQVRAFYGFTAIMALVAMIASILMARHFRRPIVELADASRKLSSGSFDIRVREAGHDELAHLAKDFNNLAHALEQNEQARQRWVADISHELRTPLAVLRGEIEALIDGVRKSDEKTLNSLHGEVICLTKLVDDLYELALSDIGALNYRKEPLNPIDVLDQVTTAFRGRVQDRDLTVLFEPDPQQEIAILADHQRFFQLFSNLMENSVRYTDPGGQIQIIVDVIEDRLMITIADSKPGVPEHVCEQLFERLYRVEWSRGRESGGAGLGMSICRNIVEAHNGTIHASPAMLGGLAVTIQLPYERR